jgi:hypothetical protein
MTKWKKIRLELARTKGFPTGSVSRGYLVQLPLDGAGRVDENELACKPRLASVRRYWSTEPDESGSVIAGQDGWIMRCNGAPDRALLLDGHPIQLGEQLSVVDPVGGILPFRIASIR